MLLKIAFNIGKRVKIGTTGCAIYRHFAALNYAVVLMTRKPDSDWAQHPRLSVEFFSFLEIHSWLVASWFNAREKKKKKKCISSSVIVHQTESIIRPLNNDSLVQEDGNKAPCYPANTVIARSAHNGTLATHSFRTHEPTEFRRKGVNLVNKFKRNLLLFLIVDPDFLKFFLSSIFK